MWSWGEFDNTTFHQFFTNRGITFRFSCPQTSSQNGKSERKIRSINNIVRTLMCHASFPLQFWPHVLNTATYLLNILPSKLLGNLTPTHLLYHKSPSYKNLRVFEYLCFPLHPSTNIHKLQPHLSPCVFLGYPSSHRGYKCCDLSSHKIIISRHVLFDEATFPFSRSFKSTPHEYKFLDDSLPSFLFQTSQNSPSLNPTRPTVSGPTAHLPLLLLPLLDLFPLLPLGLLSAVHQQSPLL